MIFHWKFSRFSENFLKIFRKFWSRKYNFNFFVFDRSFLKLQKIDEDCFHNRKNATNAMRGKVFRNWYLRNFHILHLHGPTPAPWACPLDPVSNYLGIYASDFKLLCFIFFGNFFIFISKNTYHVFQHRGSLRSIALLKSEIGWKFTILEVGR